MNLLDPARPTSHNQRAYVRPDGSAVAPIPPLLVRFNTDGTPRVSAWLLGSPNTAYEFGQDLEGFDHFRLILEGFQHDPEGLFREWGWVVPERPSHAPAASRQHVARVLSADDLGL